MLPSKLVADSHRTIRSLTDGFKDQEARIIGRQMGVLSMIQSDKRKSPAYVAKQKEEYEQYLRQKNRKRFQSNPLKYLIKWLMKKN